MDETTPIDIPALEALARTEMDLTRLMEAVANIPPEQRAGIRIKISADGPDAEYLIATRPPKVLALCEAVRVAREALAEIREGKGAFSRDPLTHCENCVEKAKHDAEHALARLDSLVRCEP